ncbi:MAG TPA: methylated-DNA--[protein]-cysteine S-methyltransferase [Flavisolibacter sp.]|nr:methylated-DNA--[protein]-cysteine S-methyltransferase [Flavisolibacter sp.]
MNDQKQYNFDRIAEAIQYLTENFKEQPSLNDVAEKLHLSPFHFQRLFTEWAGVSPKKFLQYLTIEYAKALLKSDQVSLFDASIETGLSGSGRLHDLFINIEGMTPGEYKNGGENLRIHYSFAETPFGDVLIASTEKGICHMSFANDRTMAFHELQKLLPNAVFIQKVDLLQQNALYIFRHDMVKPESIKLHLKGTPFQLKVWEALLKIPSGSLRTYKMIAKGIDNPNAVRAVGTAIGQNPVAYIIPCHRIIQSAGTFGNYHWGSNRKTAIIGWEAAQMEIKK